ncbi:Gldg family protein [Pleionea sp. CnH1-48]|uniref:GldG family protein n=1 Tax=Pleionea sp. CnH1-48 TaxID=2954494 RepID=UPI002096A027|nr:Gldg family protein [Pleionea sp. CnH1-48]MCO7226761.1 Gldg family protein [Pleionea sp. CnH1-48]
MNKNKLFSRLGFVLLAVTFVSAIMINQWLFKGVRLDLTENGLYSVSEGTENILVSIDEPINLYFFFSEKATSDEPGIRSYATRVRELLEEYQSLSYDKIRLHVIDPEPFSEDEDRATEFGLQAVAKNTQGDDIYFGLAGTNSVDDKQVMPFFHPDKEAFLEYDISKLIYQLNQAKKPKIGLIDGVSANGGMDMLSRQPKPRWVILEQMSQLFDIQALDKDIDAISEDINTLLLIQPKGLTEKAMYAIDQFVLRGGRLIVFNDPSASVDRAPASQQNPFPRILPGQDLNKLFNAWGFNLDINKVVLDNDAGMFLNTDGRAQKFLSILSMGEARMDKSSLLISGLESINFDGVGAIEPLDQESISISPVITSSQNSMTVDSERLSFLPDPSVLNKDFVADDKQYIIAAHIKGQFKSAFENSVSEEQKESHLSTSTGEANIFVVADVDVLSDRLWVQVQNVFGQQFASAFADNGDFFFNLVDVMSGSSDLIGLRGRGRYSRPFELVNNLRLQAEAQFLSKEEELKQRLEETETQLAELQASVDEQGAMVLSPEQEKAIAEFQQQKLQIRKELRLVQHQLARDIEALGNQLAFINAFFVPIVLVVLALVSMLLRRRLLTQYNRK